MLGMGRLRGNRTHSARPQRPPFRRKLLFESLEPRILLSADLYLAAESSLLDPAAAAPLVQVVEPHSTQLIHLSLKGAQDVDYDGPVSVADIDVAAFTAPGALAGAESEVAAALLASLEGAFSGTGIAFVLEPPAQGDYSTIYIGGDGAEFAQWGRFYGLSEKVDHGNADPSDEAFVFSGNIASEGLSATQYGERLAHYAAHELGHLLGLEHEHTVGAADDPLAQVAWKPYTHVEIARDVLDDVRPDGRITIAGNEYDVHPLIVAALDQHEAFYFAGSVGPDGFPDLLMGQGVIHATDTGTWLQRVLDMAWAAQDDSSFTDEEQSQILAWSYGFLTHAAGDHWAHTLVNEFAQGVFPAVDELLSDEQRNLANALRHFLVEAYIGDATAGFDNDSERTVLEDGDVSDDSTPGIPFDAPIRFIYETLIRPFPYDPTALAEAELEDDQTLTVDAANDQFVRSGGSFSDDGFKVGHKIEVSGFNANNGAFHITAISADGLRISVSEDLGAGDETASGDESISVPVPFTAKITVNADAATGSFVRADGGSFIQEGFVAGQRIAAYGLGSGYDDYLIEQVSATSLKVYGGLADATGDGDEQLVVQGKRGPALDKVFALRDALEIAAVTSGERIELGTRLSDLVAGFFDGELPTTQELDELYRAYLYNWVDEIDEGVAHWGEIGLAVTKALFDPQSRRDLQNEEGDSRGADTLDNELRADAEGSVGIIDVLLAELDDPDGDGSTSDSFINNHLLPMFGLPAEVGAIRGALQTVGDAIEPILDSIGLLFNPIRDALDSVKDFAENYLKEQLEERFGFDFEVLEFLLELNSKMDLASVTVGSTVIPVFLPGDHEKLDGFLGIAGSHHGELPEGFTASIVVGPVAFTFYAGAEGALDDDAELDKAAFAAYANSVTLSKLLLLMEIAPDGELVGAGQLSALFSDLTGETYDATLLNLNGAHGGNVLTATLPGVPGGHWLSSIDADHVWRADSRTTTTDLFRVNTQDDGASKAVWTVSVAQAGDYQIQATWLSNITQQVDNLESSEHRDRHIAPAANAVYKLFQADMEIASFAADQRLFPSDVEDGGLAFKNLGTVSLALGLLRIELSNGAAANGNVIAGPLRLSGPGGAQRIQPARNAATNVLEPDADAYSETGDGWVDLVYPTGTGNNPLWESELLRPAFRALFADWQNGAQDFPDLGDATSPDPNTAVIAKSEIPSLATPFGPQFQDNELEVPIPQALKDAINSVVDAGLGALGELGDFLDGLAILNQKIPVIDKSVNDLVDATALTGFGDAITTYVNTDGATINGLADLIASQIKSAFSASAKSTLGHGPVTVEIELSTSGIEFDVDVDAVFAQAVTVDESALGLDGNPLGLAFSVPLELRAALGTNFSFGVDFGASDVFFLKVNDPLSLSASVSATDVDITALDISGFSAGVENGSAALTFTAEVLLEGDGGDGKFSLAELGDAAVTVTVDSTLDAELPLTLAIPAIGTITDFGTPTVLITAEHLLSGTNGDFTLNAPDVSVNILLDDPDVQANILALLLDLKNNGLGGIDFLNEDLPLIDKSINELIGVGIGDILDLHTAAQEYFNQPGTHDLAGLIDWTVDHVIAHLQTLLGGSAGAGPFTLSGGFDLASHELTLQAAFDLQKSTAIDFNLSDLLPDAGGFVTFTGTANATLEGEVGAGLGIILDFDALFGDGIELQDAVAFMFEPFSLRGGLHATGINIGASLGGAISGSIQNGTLDLVLGATLGIDDPNGDGRLTLREMSTAGLGNLIELTAAASIDATLPLSVTIADFDPTKYGQPVVRISGENFVTFDLDRTPNKFAVQRPDIAFDIRITAEARNALLDILADLDQKIDGIATEGVVADVLGFELPGLGITVGDLLKINDILDAFNLYDVVKPYFDQYNFGLAPDGETPLPEAESTYPSLFGLLEALNAGVADASSVEIDPLNPENAKGNFAGFDAAGFDLRNFDFHGAILKGVDFAGANLAGVDFSGADLRGAILSGANLRGANFSGARLQGAILDGALAVGAIFKNAKISSLTSIAGLIFDRATVWVDGSANRVVAPSLDWIEGGAKLLKAGVSFAGMNLSGWDLSGLDLSGVDFTGANLSSANLRGAILKGANLANANLFGAFAVGADLTGAVTSGAQNLSRFITSLTSSTDLSGVSLRGWDLSGLNLNGIDFSDLDLSWAKFAGATNFDASDIAGLFGADLRGVSFAAAFDKVLSRVELRFANLSGLDLTGFDLSGLNLKGIKLANANLSDVDFGSALLQGVDLSAALNLGAAKLKGAFFDAVTNVGGLVGDLADTFGGVLAEIPEDLFFSPWDGPAFKFTGGFDAAALKATVGVELHLRQIFDFGFDFSTADLGIPDFELGPISLDSETLLQGDFKIKAGLGVDFGAAFGVYLRDLPSLGTGAAFIQLDSIQAGAGIKAGFDLTADLGVVSGGVVGGTAELTAGIVGDLKQGDTSKLGAELRLSELGDAVSLSFAKKAELHVELPVDIAVGDFHLSDLGLTPTLNIDDDNLFVAPGPVIDTAGFLDDLKRAALGVLTADLDFLVGDGEDERPEGVLRQLVTGIKDFATDDIFGALPLPFLPQSEIDAAAETLFAPIFGFMDLLSVSAGSESPVELLQSALFAVFGPGALNILADSDGVDGITRDDVLFTYRDAQGNVVDTLAEADAIQINLHLAKSVLFEVPVDFSGSLPGLGLDVDAELNVGVGFDFQFGFGLSISDLFYFDVSRENELVAGLSATFDAGDTIDITLGFLAFNVTDLGINRPYGPAFVNWSDFGALGDGLTGSGIVGAFNVNLRDKYAEDHNDVDDAKRLSVFEIGTPTDERPDKNPLTGANGVIEAGVHVRAEADLDMELEIGSGGQFPKIFAEFHFEWDFEHTLIGGPVAKTSLGAAPTIEFLGVSLDLGTFISKFVGPILEQIQVVTEPLEPIIEILQMRIPGVSDLAGKDITLLDLAGIFGGNKFDPAFIKTLIDIIEVINAIPTDGSTIVIGFGDFVVSGVDLRTGASLSTATAPSSSFNLDDQLSNPTGRKKGGATSAPASQQTQGFMSKLGGLRNSGLDLPIITSPSNIFGLLTGKTVDLITWDIPKLHVEFEYTQSFMIAPGLNARFGGSVYVDLNLRIGFDTRGINMFTQSIKDMPDDVDTDLERAEYIVEHVGEIFLGLYFGDHIEGTTDHPELVFGAGITAGASLGIGGLVEAGVEGGIFAEIQFDWHDVVKDNKIYLDELASRFILSPFAIFDTSGEIYAKLYAFLWIGVKVFGAKITIFDEQFDIVSKFVIADFNFVWNPDEQPVYASLVGGDLRLNVGADAGHRADDGAPDPDVDGSADESFEVRKVALSASDPLVQNGYYAAGEYYHTYFNGNPDKKLVDDLDPLAAEGEKTLIPRLYSTSLVTGEIFANDAGAGNDTIIIGSGVAAPVRLRGGSGDDQIVHKGSGAAEIYGDGGNDELRGNAQNDLIEGGAGNDFIFGGAGDDRIFGGAGNDRIFGDQGSDYIDAGDGDDTVFGDTAAPFGAVRDASGDGHDVIHGGAGNDALTGQGGNDWLYGGDGDDRLAGNEGDDYLFGGAGNDNLAGHTGVDVLDGGTGDDAIYWTSGDGIDAFIAGGAGADTYFATASSASEAISLEAVNDAPTTTTYTDPEGLATVATQSNFGLELEITPSGEATTSLLATGFEEMVIDALEGADTVEIFDLTHTGLDDLRIDLGRATATQTVTQAVFRSDGLTPVLVPMTTQVHKRHPVTGLPMYETNADGSYRLDGSGNRIAILTEALVSEVDASGNPVMQTIMVQDADAVDHDTNPTTPKLQAPKVDGTGNPVMIAIQVPTVINGTGAMTTFTELVNDEEVTTQIPLTTVITRPDGPDAGDEPDPVLDGNGNPIYQQTYTADPAAAQLPLYVQQTTTVAVPSGGKDGSADRVILHGGQSTVHGDQSAADDIFAVNAGGGEVAITRDMGVNGVMNFTLQNAERSPTTGTALDQLEILGHQGNDILDAGAVAPDIEAPEDRRDLIAIRLFGGEGDDRVIGSAFNDYLDSGLGNDVVSGLRGVDVFIDAGGTNTLLETNDADMGLFGNRFVVGSITDLIKGSKAEDDEREPLDPLFPVPFVTELAGTGDAWAAGAEVENLLNDDGSSIFARAVLQGGDSNNTLVLNDRDNVIHVAGVGDLAVTDWTGYTRLDNAANITSPGNLEAGKNEYYILNMKGGSGALVEVVDSGGTAGFNELYVYGTDNREEVYLDRASGHVTAAMLRIGPEGPGRETVLHRYVNRVNIHTLGGDDLVYSDDTAVPVIVRMGAGEDELTVGTVPQIPDPDNRTIEFPLGVPIADTENMTNGVSALFVAYGEGDNDLFEVNHNAARLFLHGGDGDDTFIINTFITLREQTPEGEAIANLNTLFGGTGNNRYDYVQNAPVFINGGAGTDTIIINGTPIADTFVITKNSVAGAGRVTYFTGVEILEVNGAGGDDVFYVLSTDPNLELVIRGGSGDDTVHLGGEHPPILFDPPPFTYQPPAFRVQDPAIVEYDRYTYDPGRITITREFGWLSSDWISYWQNPAQFARNMVSNWIFNWLLGFEIRPFHDVLAGDPNKPEVQGMTDDARANQGWFGLGGIFDLINRTVDTVQFEEISPWWYFWFDDRVSISFDIPAFTYRIGEEFLPPPRIIQPAEVTVDPPAFAYKLDGVFDIKDIQGKLTIDGGEAFETQGDKLVVHNQQGTGHTGTLTATHLQGFGLGAGNVNGEDFDGVAYESLEFVDLRLTDSATADVLTVTGTHADATRVVLGAGNDIVHVKGVGGSLDILGGAGNDTVNVHDNGSLGAIASRVTFDGDAHVAEQVFTLPYDPAIHASIIANSPYVYVQTDPNGPGSLVFNPAPGTGSAFRYQQESKAQIVFVKDLDGNGPDIGDEVWVRAAEVSPDTQQRGRQEVGHQERGVENANGSITVTDNEGDDLIWRTLSGARTLTDTGIQSISVTNTGENISLPGDVPIYLDELGRRTTAVTTRQSILVTNQAGDALLYLDAERQPTTVNTGTAFIAGGILVENKVQERGVQEVGFQQTGQQERGFQSRGHQSTGMLDGFGNIVITNDLEDDLVFLEANGDRTFIDTGIQHITVTDLASDALLFLDFRSRLTTVDTGTQAVEATGLAGDPLLWRDANGKRTTTDTGVQSIAITNTTADARLWIDANGNLTTVAGNAPKMNGTVQARGVHERTSSQQLLYLTENNTETTAVTERPKITVTNNKFDDLLYINSSGHVTTDAGNRMAIASAATAGQLLNNGLTVVSIWVEDDNDKTTTNTQFKSFTNTPDGKVPGTNTSAPLLWIDQAGRKVDVFFEQFDQVFSGGENQNVLIYRSRPSLIEVQSSIDRPILHTQDLYQTIAGTDTLNIVNLATDATGTLDTYTRAVDQVVSQEIVLHDAGDRAIYLGGEAARAGDPIVVVDGGVLKLKTATGLIDFPGPDGALPAEVLRYGADPVYAGGELVFDEFTLAPVMVFENDDSGVPVQVQKVREAGEAVLHYAGEAQFHLPGERREYQGDEPIFGQNGAQVRDVLNNILRQPAGAPVLAGQPVIVRQGDALYLDTHGGLVLITAATTLPLDVKRWESTDALGQVFYTGGEAVYHTNTDRVQVNRQFATLTTDGLPSQLDWVGVDNISITLGNSANDFTVESTLAASSTTLNLQGGDDHAWVKSMAGSVTVNAGDDDDTVDVWNDDARLYDIDATLTINGGAPSASDTVNIINTLDFDGTPGTLSATTLSGLGMGGSIVYGTVETLNISLGIGDDELEILSTAAGTVTNVGAESGNDLITVRSTGGTTNLFTGEGADTVTVTGSGAGGLDTIDGNLFIEDDDADQLADVVNITDATLVAKSGMLTDRRLTGMNMSAFIDYLGFEQLNLTLGGGGDVLNVASTMAGETSIDAAAGADQVKIETLAGTVLVKGGANDDVITLFDGTGDAAAPDATLEIDVGGGNLGDDVILNLGRSLGLTVTITDSNPGFGVAELFLNTTEGADKVFLDAGADEADLTDGIIVVGERFTPKRDAMGFILYNVQATDGDGEPLFDEFDQPVYLNALGQPAQSPGEELLEVIDDGFTYDPERLREVLVTHPDRDDVGYNLMDKVWIRTHGGADLVQMDDNAVLTDIDLGAGNDLINVATVETFIDDFGVEVVNVERTTPGNSAIAHIHGGLGNDEFNIFHNEAKLFLFGDDGDDVFAVFTFLVIADAPAEGEEEAGTADALNLTTIDGGTGSNSYEYLQNAPVEIVGGEGTDTLVLTGTGIKDVFVVTDKFIAGAGRQLLLKDNIERVIVNGAGGDDEIYVLSTKAGVETIIRGGSGDDIIHVAGDHPVLVFDPPPESVQPPAVRRVDYIYSPLVLNIDPSPYERVVALSELSNIQALNEAQEIARYGGVVRSTRINFSTQTISLGWFGSFSFSVPTSLTILVDPPAFNLTIPRWITQVTLITPPAIEVDQPPYAFKVDAVHDLTGIKGALTIEGGAGAGDQILVHNEDGTALPGVLDRKTFDVEDEEGNPAVSVGGVLTGLGMGAGGFVDFHEIEDVDIRLGEDNDVFTIENTFDGTTRIVAGAGDDTVNIERISGDTTVWGGAGNDVFNVHDDAATLSGIDAVLTIDGDAHVWDETVNWKDGLPDTPVPASSLVVNAAGQQYSLRVAGETVEQFDGPAFVKVALLDANGAVVTAGVTKTIVTRTVELPFPNKVVHLESHAGDDALNLLNTGDDFDTTLSVDGDSIGAGNMGGEIVYAASPSTIEELNISLGGGADVVEILGTNLSTATLLRAGGGNDTIRVGRNGSLDDILGTLTIDAEGGDENRLVVDDSADPDADLNVEIYADLIRGLAAVEIRYLATLGAFSSQVDDDGQFAAGIEISAGSGSDAITILGSRNTLGLVEVTRVKAGAGDDDVFIEDAEARYLEVHGGAGGDEIAVLAGAGFGGVAAFGDEGDDTIVGGSGDDVLVGGLGTDDINGGAGADVIVGDNAEIRRDAFYAVQRITGLADEGDGGDILSSSLGNDVIIGGGGSDDIDALTDGSIIIGDAGTVVFADGSGDAWDIFSDASGAGGNDIIDSGANSIVLGGLGSDTITLGAGFNIVVGDSGLVRRTGPGAVTQVQSIGTSGARDTITSAGGVNIILGGLGDDLIDAAAGSNVVLGDNGTANFGHDGSWDIYTTERHLGGDDTIVGGADNIVLGGFGADTITLGGGSNTVVGDHGIVRRNALNEVTQVANTDTEAATGGADTVTTQGGTNVIIGGLGADTIELEAPEGLNVLLGDNGVANFGHDGSWHIFTTNPDLGGDDVVTSAGGTNLIFGGLGADTLTGAQGNDIILGDHGGVDRDLSGAVTRVVSTDPAAGDGDVIVGGDGDDVIMGGSGADVLQGGLGNDTVFGDHGEVVFVDGALTAASSIHLAEGGDDLMFGDQGTGFLLTEPHQGGHDVMFGGAGNDVMFGGAGDDQLHGESGGDYMEGNIGADTLYGGDGDDDMIGGSSDVSAPDAANRPDGGDYLDGGAGRDLMIGDNGRIARRLELALPPLALLELDLMGGDDVMHGGAGDDVMHGGLGNDVMYGGDGNDEMYGELGDDFMDGGAGDDGMLGDKGTLTATILEGTTARTLTVNGTNLAVMVDVPGTLRWDAILEEAANGGNDVMHGGDGNDAMHGGAGHDEMDGGAGNDAMFGDAGNDVMTAGAGDDHLFGGAGDDDLDGALGNDIAFGGDGSDTLRADSAGDFLIDWIGPRNTFIHPGSGLSRSTVIVSPSPAMRSFLLELAAADGAIDANAEITVVPPGNNGGEVLQPASVESDSTASAPLIDWEASLDSFGVPFAPFGKVSPGKSAAKPGPASFGDLELG